METNRRNGTAGPVFLFLDRIYGDGQETKRRSNVSTKSLMLDLIRLVGLTSPGHSKSRKRAGLLRCIIFGKFFKGL